MILILILVLFNGLVAISFLDMQIFVSVKRVKSPGVSESCCENEITVADDHNYIQEL
jgi:hypothetical protein